MIPSCAPESGAASDLQCAGGGAVAGLGGGLQADAVYRHVREFLGHEEAVGGDDRQDDEGSEDQCQDWIHA